MSTPLTIGRPGAARRGIPLRGLDFFKIHGRGASPRRAMGLGLGESTFNEPVLAQLALAEPRSTQDSPLSNSPTQVWVRTTRRAARLLGATPQPAGLA
ncbi:MAG: hypothetical protein LBN10_01690 [Propionibacteriaceae bacterium]|jgi:hypothetical protein|nr:hypothetical protein [Propionibacteriaceae bacterium]